MKMITERLKFADIFPDKAVKVAQRLHIKKDEIPFVRKYYTAEKDKTEIKKKERAVISYISTGKKDRDGEKLMPEGVLLENYRKNPIVPFSHDYRTVPPAKNMWIKQDEKGLIAKTIFAKNQRAEDIYQAYTEDIGGTGPLLNAWSVGFIPIEWEDTDTKALEKDPSLPKRTYNKWELLEYSAVPIPSCPEALTIAVEKNLIPETLKKDLEIEIVKDKKDRVIELTMEDIKDKPIFEKKIKDVFVKEVSGDLKKHLDEQDEKFIHGDKEIEIEIGGVISSKPEIDIEEAEGEIEALIDKKTKATIEQKLEAFVRKYDLQFMKSEYSLLDVINKFAGTYHLDIDYDKKGNVIITKPETTENYHRIPIESPDKHKGHRIRTIVISASKGIKALYCGECKRVITYLFDVEKWTMEEAKTWISEHKSMAMTIEALGDNLDDFLAGAKKTRKEKTIENLSIDELLEAKKPQYKERWNNSFSKLFDIASAESSAPMRFHYDLYEKFLECKVKEVFQNTYTIPGPLMGSYLAALKDILGKFDLKDTRRFSWAGDETPPNYEVVQLNSEKSDDFLIDGMQFYEAEKKPLIMNYSPDWYGITITLTTSTTNKKWNKELLDKVHAWVQENNFLRGEKFALSGEFLKEPGDNWDNLILKDKYKDAIMMSAKALEKKGEKLVGRGLLFIGPPGTGKTKTGRVLMNELDATFIWVSSRDFRHIGPLRALAIGFSMARDLAPSVLFLEDIDTWLRGEMEYVTDSLKTEMDGIKQNRGMITIMTSNYPEKLPPALLDRPGRFHHIVNFELPDGEQRKEMIKLWAGDIDEKLLDELAEKTDGFSGAHLKELVEFAKMIAEEDEIEIGDAMLRSLDKLMEQRELIEEIRDNKTDAKAVWGRVKYVEGEVKVMEDKLIEIKADEKQKFNCECIKCGHKMESDKHCNEIKCPECGGKMRRVERPGPGREVDGGYVVAKKENVQSMIDELEQNWDKLLKQKDEVISEKDEIIADLKEGRVLSRKNRKIVKDAITALNAVLKADATGTQEDEESETGTVTERGIEIVREGEREFSKEDIAKVVKEVSGEQMGEILEGAFKKALDPEKIKAMVGEGIRLELDKLRGKVT